MMSFNPMIVQFKPIAIMLGIGVTILFQSYDSSIQTDRGRIFIIGHLSFQSYDSSIQTCGW